VIFSLPLAPPPLLSLYQIMNNMKESEERDKEQREEKRE